MSEDLSHEVSRRTFLSTTGSFGVASALPNVAAGDGGAVQRDDSHALIAGVSDGARLRSVENRLPTDVLVRRKNETLGYLLLELSGREGEHETLVAESRIAGTDGVKYVSRRGMLRHCGATSDKKYEEQYAPQQVRADQVWDTVSASGVTIGVVDSGIDYEHPDLEDRFGSTKGKDFRDSDDDPMPESSRLESHGTHVAGIAAASTDNETGVAGISDARLLSARVSQGFGDDIPTDVVADAIQWAADQGADVINLSLGGPPAPVMKEAVSYAFDSGSLPVAATGNDGADSVSYPAGYDEALAVSALDENERLASFSNTGPKVDLAGPGDDVLSTVPSSPLRKYGQKSGTSMATPVVSGVAALALAADPGLSPSGLRAKLKDTAVDIGLSDREQGAGRVDAPRAVGSGGGSGDNRGPAADISVSPTDPHVGEEVVVSAGSSDDPDGFIETWEWDLGDGTTSTGRRVAHSYDSPGEYTVQLTVTDDGGAMDTATATVSVESGSCGGTTVEETLRGSIGDDERTSRSTYDFQTTDPCKLTAVLSGRDDSSFGSEHTLKILQGSDFERYGSDGRLVLRSRDLRRVDPSRPLTVLVSADWGSKDTGGRYEVAIVEQGYTDGGDDPATPPTASFTPTKTTISPGGAVSFDASASGDPDGSIERYEWEFGDGSVDSGRRVTHTYDSGGRYDVTLTVTDADGLTDTATGTVTVESSNASPTAAFRVSPGDPSPGESVTLDGSDSSDPDGTLESYSWDLGDGSRELGESVTYTFDGSGEYDVTLTVTDDDGATATNTKTVVVGDASGDDGTDTPGCGDETATLSESGELSGTAIGHVYSYVPVLADPCQVTIRLLGPSEADFDVYVTANGREPTPAAADHEYESYAVEKSEERLGLDGSAFEDRIGILVHSYDGSGSYRLVVEEQGDSGERSRDGGFEDEGERRDDVWTDPEDPGDGEDEPGDAPSPAFEVGDRVETTVDLNVRDGPGLDESIRSTAPLETAGYVRQGPEFADGYVWWKVEYNAGYRGWCVQEYLTAAPIDRDDPDDGDDGDDSDDDDSGSDAKFSNGERVESTVNLNVRSSPGLDDDVKETVSPGSGGYVRAGPRSSDGYTWYKVAYNAGVTGWSAAQYLESASLSSASVLSTTAVVSLERTTVPVGRPVTFDAGRSVPADAITEYRWSFGDGSTDTGRIVRHAYEEPGDYRVELEVVDSGGNVDVATETVAVRTSGAGSTTATTKTERLRDRLPDDGSAVYAYEPRSADPLEITVQLSGPPETDFDLHVTTDGRPPTLEDNDAESTTGDSNEQVVLDSVAATDELGILVRSWKGAGEYELTVEERGR